MKKRTIRTDFKVDELHPGIYRINEFDVANCYLIVGQERALLIDTGTGIGNIGAVVRGITSLPVDVAATHGHPDHLGGKNWFTHYYIHPDDEKMSRKISPALRTGLLLFQGVARKKYSISLRDLAKGDHIAEPRLMDEGHRFELGGRTVEVYHTPGHTRGSVIFKLVEDQIVFSGDDVNPFLFLFLPGSTTVRDWIPGAERILSLSEGCTNYCGHGADPIPPEQICAQIRLAKELVRRGNRFPLPLRIAKCPDAEALIFYRPAHVI